MTAAEVKASLAKAARRCWPNVTKASNLPFPEYWKAVTEWLTFHAPHVGDALMWKLIDEFAVSAKEAEERGLKPVAPIVPDKVKKIWSRAVKHRSKTLKAGTARVDPEPPSPFCAPFSGPKPGTLKRTKRLIEQGRLL